MRTACSRSRRRTSLIRPARRRARADFTQHVRRDMPLAHGSCCYHRASKTISQEEGSMITMTKTLRTALGLVLAGFAAAVLTPLPAAAQNQHMEIIHHPNYDKTV